MVHQYLQISKTAKLRTEGLGIRKLLHKWRHRCESRSCAGGRSWRPWRRRRTRRLGRWHSDHRCTCNGRKSLGETKEKTGNLRVRLDNSTHVFGIQYIHRYSTIYLLIFYKINLKISRRLPAIITCLSDLNECQQIVSHICYVPHRIPRSILLHPGL